MPKPGHEDSSSIAHIVVETVQQVSAIRKRQNSSFAKPIQSGGSKIAAKRALHVATSKKKPKRVQLKRDPYILAELVAEYEISQKFNKARVEKIAAKVELPPVKVYKFLWDLRRKEKLAK